MTKMSAKRHLRELQWRFMIIALFFVAGAALAYTYRDIILPVFLAPLGGEKLIYLTPGGGFTFALLVSVYAGIAVAFPILLQQLYAFLGPALPVAARKKSLIILICSLLLLVAGVLFGYFIAVPSALTFLYGFADAYVESSLTADSYTNFVVAYTIGIGIVFQIPLLLLLLHTIKPLKPGGLMKSQKWVVLGAFIVAAILTPTPDPVNQAIMAGPVIVVYQLGVAAVLFSIYKTSRSIKKQERRVQKANSAALSQLAHQSAFNEAEAEEAPAGQPLLATEPVAQEAPDATTPKHQPLTATIEAMAHVALNAKPQAEPVAREALEAELPPAPAKAHATPVASTPHPKNTLAQTQRPRAIDGFSRRPAVPQHAVRRAVPARPSVVAPQPARPRFGVDGIIAPRAA